MKRKNDWTDDTSGHWLNSDAVTLLAIGLIFTIILALMAALGYQPPPSYCYYIPDGYVRVPSPEDQFLVYSAELDEYRIIRAEECDE